MSHISWFVKYLLLPLAPFFIGAVIRFAQAGIVEPSIFSVTEFSVSFAMLCLLLVVNGSRLDDKSLGDFLVSFFSIGFAIFIAMFAVATLLETQLQSNSDLLARLASDSTRAAVDSPDRLTQPVINLLNQRQEQIYRTVFILRTFVGLWGIVAISVAGWFKIRYKLED